MSLPVIIARFVVMIGVLMVSTLMALPDWAKWSALLFGAVWAVGWVRITTLFLMGINTIMIGSRDKLLELRERFLTWFDWRLRGGPDPLASALLNCQKKLSFESLFRLRRSIDCGCLAMKEEAAKKNLAFCREMFPKRATIPNTRFLPSLGVSEHVIDFFAIFGAFVASILAFLLIMLLCYWFTRMVLAVASYAKDCLADFSFTNFRVAVGGPLIPEKVMPGSTFVNKPTAPGQAEVYTNNVYNGLNYSGQCFRVGTSLITATHVIQGADTIHVKVGKVSAVFTQANVRDLGNDVSLIKATEAQLSELGLKKLKLSEELLHQRMYVQVTARGKMSGGHLSRGRDNPRDVHYMGSTIAGFSGAPYMYGDNLVVGMHQAGGAVNVGMAAAYIRHDIRKRVGKVDEDSHDWLLDQAVKHGFEIMRTSTPGEYLVEVNNRVFDLTQEDYDQIYERRRVAVRQPENAKDEEPEPKVEDHIPPEILASGNVLRAPVDVGALGQHSRATVSVREQKRIPQPQQESAFKVSRISDMDGLKQMLVQQSVRMESMQNTLCGLMRNQRKRRSRSLSPEPSKNTRPGKATPV